MEHSPPRGRYDLRNGWKGTVQQESRTEEGLVSGTEAPSEPKGPAGGKGAHAVPPSQGTSITVSAVPAVPQLDSAITTELLSRMTELCSLVAKRLDAGSVSPPQAQAPLRLNLPVPTFSGYTDKKSVADSLDDLTAYQTGMGISDEVLIQRILQVALIGDAARWLRLQSRFTSVQDFQKRFKSEFLPPDYEYRILEELHKRTQHPDETLAEFVRALQDLYSRAEPTATEEQRVTRAIRQCHPRYRPYLRAHRFNSLEALAQEARSIEGDLLAELDYRPPPPPELALEPRCAWSAGAASVERPPAVGLDEPNRNYYAEPSRRAPDPFRYEQRAIPAGTSLGRPVLSHNHGQPGYLAGETPRRPQEQRHAPRQQRRMPAGCWTCGSPDHFRRDCPQQRPNPRNVPTGNGRSRRR
ncbi:uncharacterized protein LOC135378939 [Ornithodoros turicata]|uniref:uncharacterized protein LOC135378939 n=1 Tax=Ornithodoros turicata TaxID=34597 RepID=UPI00313875A5